MNYIRGDQWGFLLKQSWRGIPEIGGASDSWKSCPLCSPQAWWRCPPPPDDGGGSAVDRTARREKHGTEDGALVRDGGREAHVICRPCLVSAEGSRQTTRSSYWRGEDSPLGSAAALWKHVLHVQLNLGVFIRIRPLADLQTGTSLLQTNACNSRGSFLFVKTNSISPFLCLFPRCRWQNLFSV